MNFTEETYNTNVTSAKNENPTQDSSPDNKTSLYLMVAFIVLLVVLIVIGVITAVAILRKRRQKKEAKAVEKIYGNIDFSFCNDVNLRKEAQPQAAVNITGINFEMAESAAQY